MQRKWGSLILCAGFGLFAAGCPKGHSNFNLGEKAQNLEDWDAAYNYYQKAVKEDPHNASYKIRLDQARFEAGEAHIKKGLELRKRGDIQSLQLASGEFQRALAIDPASSIAEQELSRTAEMLAEKEHQGEATPTDQNQQPLASMPPEIKPLSHAPISMKMSNDAKIVFDTIGKTAGLTVVYDPDFPARRITVDFNNVTLEQALEITALESKAVIKPVTENTIFVYPDQPQKRRDYDEEVVKTFYLSNVTQPQELTEIQTGLRQLLDLKRIQQVNSQNALIIRDTPDKLMLVQKMIDDIDKAKPEVLVQVEVLEVSSQRIRELGITPGQSASVTFSPGTTTSSSTGGTSTTTTTPLSLNDLKHLSTKDYSVTLPSATATALLSDTATKILQNPEIRSVDGQIAHLKIGQRIPVATGSFQAGVGVGSVGQAGFVNPLVNTQFTYLDVGVNVDMTPRVHPDHEVSMKLMIEISSQLGSVNIGGITQPIISSRKIEHEIRLTEGEVNILGGLFQRTDTTTLTGWPGLGQLPILGRLFSDKRTEHDEDEVLIVLTPRIVRMPLWTKANLRPMLSGTETFVETKRESELRAPQPEQTQPTPAPQPPRPQPQMPQQQPASANPAAPQQGSPAANAGAVGKIRFEPQTLTLKAGQVATVGVVVENVNDLYSIPLLLQYNPKVISVEEVQHGGFLSNGGAQEISIVSQPFKDKGQYIISATRPPSTPGVSGSGTLLGLVVKAVAPGSSPLSVVQVNAKDSQQKSIPLVTSEATLQVQP